MNWLSFVRYALVAVLLCHIAIPSSKVVANGEWGSAQVNAAFASSHDGFSVDEVLLDDGRRAKFVEACRELSPELSEKECFESLVRYRKAGKLTAKATKRRHDEYEDELAAAEIAARMMQDEFEANMDDVLIDPEKLVAFDERAQKISPESDRYLLRKAALFLRKSRQLRPELVSRVTEWHRTIVTMSLQEAIDTLDKLPTDPGVYIFRDESGYLYIGQSNNLRERLTKHIKESDRVALAEYLMGSGINRDSESSSSETETATSHGEITLELHIFGKDSPAQEKEIREAYESDLIRTRKPKLNLKP